MEKLISYEKLSKREKRKMDLAKCRHRGERNPATHKPRNSKVYNRKRTQEWKKELPLLRPSLWIPVSSRVFCRSFMTVSVLQQISCRNMIICVI